MTDFEILTNEIDKSAQNVGGSVDFEPNDVLPNPIIRAFIKIEDSINDANEAIKAKKLTLSKASSVALNKLKQKIKKYLQSTGPSDNNYEKQLLKFREKPVWSEDERAAADKASGKKKEEKKVPAAKKKVVESSEESEESESEDEDSDVEDKKKKKVVTAPKKPAVKKGSGSEDEESEEEESEEEESEEEESEEESSEEEEVNIFNMPREQLTPAQRRLKWVK
jgi:hypothetical protein